MALSDSLVSFWELDESSGTRYDSHGSNDLSDNNTVGSATGKVGNAADFETSNSEFLSHSSNSDLEMGDIDFTLCAWVQYESAINSVIIGKSDGNFNHLDYVLDYFGTDFRFYFKQSALQIVTKAQAITLGNWYFLVAWHDAAGNTLNLQVNNGTAASAGTSGNAPDVSSSLFEIGARQHSGFEGWHDGLIDQVGIWKRALTTDERTALYNSGNGLAYADIAPATATVGAGVFASRVFGSGVFRSRVF